MEYPEQGADARSRSQDGDTEYVDVKTHNISYISRYVKSFIILEITSILTRLKMKRSQNIIEIIMYIK